MRSVLYVLMTAALSIAASGCGTAASNSPATDHSSIAEPAQNNISPSSVISESSTAEGGPVEAAITLTVGGQTFTVTLEDNTAAQELSAQLPLSMDMSELNGNEKYFYTDTQFTTDASRPGQIQAGDLMLYGNNCIVLFYETFSSSYSYTRLGRIDDPEGLASALGAGAVTVTISADA